MKRYSLLFVLFAGCASAPASDTPTTRDYFANELDRARARAASAVLVDYWTTTATFEPGVGKGTASQKTARILVEGMKQLRSKMEIHANNLTNANTTAFKRSRANFSDLFYDTAEKAGFGTVELNQKPTGKSSGNGARIISIEKIFEQGSLARTERDLDLAIDGDGFFRIRLPDDTIAYTRAGNFNIDSDGNIVTPEGYLLDPQMTIPENITRLLVDQTGLMQGFDPDTPQTLQQLDQMQVTRFINPSGLESIGENQYRITPAAGDAIEGTPGTGHGFGFIRQGFLENSNVEIEQEALELRQTLQLYRTLRSLLSELSKD